MKTRSIGTLIAGLVAILALSGSPAGAGSATGPEIIDPAGDAHFVNGHDYVLGQEAGPDGRPASIDSADITAIWFETAYSTVKDTDALGNVTAVRHFPTGLLVKVRTSAPPVPSFGPSLVYRVPVKIGACQLEFDAVVAGPASTPADDPQGTYYWKAVAACPGGSNPGLTTKPGLVLNSTGNVLTMSYPFSTFPYSSKELVLAPDVEIKARPCATGATAEKFCNPAVQVYYNWLAGPGFIDETRALPTRFRIGSDVPANVDCTVTPTPAACSA